MNVAIAGYGVEGKVSYDYYVKLGHSVTIADESDTVIDLPAGVNTITGSDAFAKLSDFDLIIRAPGINPKKLPYGEKVWSATSEFFAKCPAPIIGVTGTKGKGTTSSFITHILKESGKTVHLVGNIGVPALSELASITSNDIVVYELSSFQLWDAKKSPHVAVVLGIEPDHLDVHDNMENYVSAKSHIAVFQAASDIVVYNRTNDIASDIAMQSAAEKRAYPVEDITQLISDSLVIPGAHNVENACAAVLAVREYVTDIETIRRGLASFTGLPHRLKFVTEKHGVKYYDDSIATTPGSAIAALMSFEAPKLIILGGHGKGADYTELIETCGAVDATVLAIGSNREEIAQLCREENVPCVEEAGGMLEIVARAADIAGKGSVVILSPAAASFDMFKSYSDRGDQFIAALNSL